MGDEQRSNRLCLRIHSRPQIRTRSRDGERNWGKKSQNKCFHKILVTNARFETNWQHFIVSKETTVPGADRGYILLQIQVMSRGQIGYAYALPPSDPLEIVRRQKRGERN